jgi:hypothetical protein
VVLFEFFALGLFYGRAWHAVGGAEWLLDAAPYFALLGQVLADGFQLREVGLVDVGGERRELNALIAFRYRDAL